MFNPHAQSLVAITPLKKQDRKEVSEETARRIREIGEILKQKDAPRDTERLSGGYISEEEKKKRGSGGENVAGSGKQSSNKSNKSTNSYNFGGRNSRGAASDASSSISTPGPGQNNEGEGSTEKIGGGADQLERAEEEIEKMRQELTKAEIETATAILQVHIAVMEEERGKEELKRKEEKKAQEELEKRDKEIGTEWAKNFVPVGKQMQMLKTAMRFVPGVNTAPNVKGHVDDPPYLFKTPGRVIDRKRKADYQFFSEKSGSPNSALDAAPAPDSTSPGTRSKSPSPGPTARLLSLAPTATSPGVSKTKFPRPVFGLNWPSQGSQLIYRSHHNLLIAFLAYYNKKAEAEMIGSSGTDLYDPSLSISCALACGKSPYPPNKLFLTKMPVPTDSSAMYTPVPISVTGVPEDWHKVAANIGFMWPSGFGPQPDGTFVPLPLEYYMPQNQPLFPELSHLPEIPQGATAGYLDSSGNFYIPEVGDPLPPDVTIGYLDEEGIYHHVMDLSEGLENGRIPYKQVYPYYPSDDDLEGGEREEGKHFSLPHGNLLPGTFTQGQFKANYPAKYAGQPSQFPPGFPGQLPSAKIHHTHHGFISDEDYLPGDPAVHQSEVVFSGQGGAIAAQKNKWKDTEKKKRKKKRKKTRYLSEEGEEEGITSSMVDLDEDEEGSGSGSEYDSDEDEGNDEGDVPPISAIEGEVFGPPIMYDASILIGETVPAGLTKKDIVKRVAPPGSRAGYLGPNGQFIHVPDSKEFPDSVAPGYMDERGVFHQILIPILSKDLINERLSGSDEVPTGFVDEEGVFHSTQPKGGSSANSTLGYIDEDGVFIELLEGEKPPPGVTPGHLDESGMFHIANKLPSGAKVGYIDDSGNFQVVAPGEEIPAGKQGGHTDSDGVFHLAPGPAPISEEEAHTGTGAGRGADQGAGQGRGSTGKKRPPPVIMKPGRYIEDLNELVEIEVHDENDLDENGQPKIKVVLRHRGSIAPPSYAQDIEGGGKVWIEGNEEITEMPYLDHNDLDAQGKPKVKRMRVRMKIGDKPGQAGARGGRQGPHPRRSGRGPSRYRPSEDDDGDWEDLRDQPLSASERERLLEFQRNIGVQVQLDYIEGSLDLGEVVRKSFRIYSHGGSIDIDPAAVIRHASQQMTQSVLNVQQQNEDKGESQDEDERESPLRPPNFSI